MHKRTSLFGLCPTDVFLWSGVKPQTYWICRVFFVFFQLFLFLPLSSFLVLVCRSTTCSICLILSSIFLVLEKVSVLVRGHEGECGLSGFVCTFINKFALHSEGLRYIGQLCNSPTEVRENTDDYGSLPRRRLVGY